MSKICYIPRRFSAASQELINKCNTVITSYEIQGFDLTLRQLYYQCVSRNYIPNTDKSYKNLGSLINDARLAGQVDWNRITDLTRELRQVSHWNSPASIMAAAASSFRIDKWKEQDYRPEVWVEKDALRNVVERACNALDVPFFVCRGYTSQSEMWGAAQRLKEWQDAEQTPIIFHFGDHDPSGVDMTRDIRDRLTMFDCEMQIDRIALTMDQVEEYSPPPNPAKISDSRATGYIEKFGDESWELDALDPSTLAALIETAILGCRDEEKWEEAVEEENTHRALLKSGADHWPGVVKYLNRCSVKEK